MRLNAQHLKRLQFFQALMNVPTTFSNVYASISKIPMVGPYLAPVMATAAAATQVAQAMRIKGYNLTGRPTMVLIDKVPETGTWLLKKVSGLLLKVHLRN
jgi:hypothetical protein